MPHVAARSSRVQYQPLAVDDADGKDDAANSPDEADISIVENENDAADNFDEPGHQRVSLTEADVRI